MSALMDKVYEKAKALNKHIVLAEGEEQRIIDAAVFLTQNKIARITLIGNKETIVSKSSAAALEGVNILDPVNAEAAKKYTDLLFELRKSKGMTYEQAEKLSLNPLYFGVLMVKSGDADGMVAGAVNSTGDVLRPALQIIKTKPNINIVSSCFIMCLKTPGYGDNGVMVFGDCAVNINPDAEGLAAIALASADSARKIAGIKEPKVAMLSFSTKGSAKHEFVDKVTKATELVKAAEPGLCVDGELQADAAIIPGVSKQKAPGSCIAGLANVLIFPDLQAGNIGYKLVQRLAGAEAIGPICQGLSKPVNDLSRACSVDDVIGVAAMTALQSE